MSDAAILEAIAEAYTKRDLAKFQSYFSSSFTLADKNVTTQGKPDLEEVAFLFTAERLYRIDMHSWVIDHLRLAGGSPAEIAAAYHVEHGKLTQLIVLREGA